MIKRRSTENVFGIDVFRGLSIILMFITHGGRLYKDSGDPSGLGSLLNFFFLIEPFTSASFLFLVGVGINLSYQNTKLSYRDWLNRNMIKAGQLYLIGLLFFFIEYGFQWPEMLLGSNILSVIALSIVGLSLSVSSPLRMVSLSILISLITLFCEGTAVTGVNTGPGGAFPLMLFSFLGYLSYQLIKTHNKLIWGLLGIGLIIWFFPFSPLEYWTQTYPSIYNHFVTGQTGLDYLQSMGVVNGYTKVGFWNHTFISVFRLFVPLTLILGLLVILSNFLKNYFPAHVLARLGRHALGLYLLHLSIIAVADISGFRPTSALIDWVFIIGLILIGYCYARAREN
jgi:hypothetical protein